MQAHHASRFEAFYAPRDQWFSFQLYPTGRGASVYFEDVTDRKRTEQRLATQYAVTAILAESPSLADAGRRILAAVCTANQLIHEFEHPDDAAPTATGPGLLDYLEGVGAADRLADFRATVADLIGASRE